MLIIYILFHLNTYNTDFWLWQEDIERLKADAPHILFATPWRLVGRPALHYGSYLSSWHFATFSFISFISIPFTCQYIIFYLAIAIWQSATESKTVAILFCSTKHVLTFHRKGDKGQYEIMPSAEAFVWVAIVCDWMLGKRKRPDCRTIAITRK
jgi:hypothetical protein